MRYSGPWSAYALHTKDNGLSPSRQSSAKEASALASCAPVAPRDQQANGPLELQEVEKPADIVNPKGMPNDSMQALMERRHEQGTDARNLYRGWNMQSDSNRVRGDFSFQEHVHGALSIGTLLEFYSHECQSQSVIHALGQQNGWAIAGLAVLSIISAIYICGQVRKLWRRLFN